MTIPKKYFQDRLILLLLSVGTFVGVLTILVTVLRLNTGRPNGYTIQYRSNLGLLGGGAKTGNATTFVSFLVFAALVMAFHTLMSIRVYRIRRQLAITILSLGILLLTLSFIVSNALLGIR